MPGIGLISNPHSRINRRSPRALDRLRAQLGPDDVVELTADLDDLHRVARAFRDRDIDVLALNGGDGTNHVTLSAFVEVWGDAPLPPVALLCGGTMNTVARGFGIRGRPPALLSRVVAAQRAGRQLPVIERPLLRITADGDPSYGFIFGNGVVYNFLSEYYAHGDVSPAVAARLLARSVASVLVGGELSERLFRPFSAAIEADGVPWLDDEFVAVMASNQPELGLGFRPFSRCGERDGAFHAVAIKGPHVEVVKALPTIRMAGPLGERPGFDDRVCSALTFRSSSRIGYTIDGDIYSTDEPVRVEAGPKVRVLVP